MDNELNKKVPKTKENPSREERVLVEMADGTLMWLQGEALERYDKGELELNGGFKTPELEQKRAEILEEISRIAEELYSPSAKKT